MRTPSRINSYFFQLVRLAVFAAIVALIRYQHVRFTARQAGVQEAALTLDVVRRLFPEAARLTGWDAAHGGRGVADAAGRTLGIVVQTSPPSDRVIGYSGPTNTLVGLDADDRILGIEVLHSGDTPEHVAQVIQDRRFMTALRGLTWDEAAQAKVDGVSGATLTSMSIAEGIRVRLGGSRPSHLFPQPLSLEEVRSIFPTAARLEPAAGQPAVLEVRDARGELLGSVARTSPAADREMGYQGPTDTLMVFDAQGLLMTFHARHSFDNQPYVGYLDDDDYFLSIFRGKSLAELAALDLQAEQVEGVSGATMTSQAVARGLVRAAGVLSTSPAPVRRSFSFAARDAGTVSVVALAVLMSFTRLRGYRGLRIAFQLLLVGYLGLLNGDLLSQALLVGWARSGVPWHLAPGLVLLTAAALVLPVVTRRQVYCHHVCPFGALQQLTRSRLPWRWHLSPRATQGLRALPGLLLLLVVLTAMLHVPLNLAGIEPFDAFVFWVAGTATLAVAAVGLLASLVVPMAYCRFGCPTGGMLEFLRFHGRSGRLGWRDGWAAALLIAALTIYLADITWPA